VGSSPTPGAIVVNSSEYFISLNQQNNIVKSLQEPTGKENKVKVGKEKIKEKIDLICKYQKPFVKKSLENLLTENIDNTEIICNYIIAEQNEINIKESTKEGKIKVLADLLRFLKHKALSDVSKEDILSYLNRFRKPEEIDAKHS
jgi:hypothetical protein